MCPKIHYLYGQVCHRVIYQQPLLFKEVWKKKNNTAQNQIDDEINVFLELD